MNISKNKVFSRILAVFILLALWQLGSAALGKPFLPAPLASFAEFVRLCASGELPQHFAVSAARVLISIAAALLTAVPLGLLMGRSRAAGRLLDPLIYVLYPIPKVVFLPVLVVLLGLGNAPKILLVTMVIFFQVVIVARDAAKSIPAASVQSMRSLGAGRPAAFWHLILPYCLPKILTALRISIGTAIAVLFFAETFASFDGLGYFIQNGMETRNYPGMYAGIMGMALLGVILYAAVDLLEKRLCRWQQY